MLAGEAEYPIVQRDRGAEQQVSAAA